jgi:hypothetical protein
MQVSADSRRRLRFKGSTRGILFWEHSSRGLKAGVNLKQFVFMRSPVALREWRFQIAE